MRTVRFGTVTCPAVASILLVLLAVVGPNSNAASARDDRAGQASHVDVDELNAAAGLDVRVHTVVTGGCWSQNGSEGFYRLVTYEGGFEELYHHLYVQLVQLDWEQHKFRIMKTVPIKETEGFALVFQDLQLTSRRGTCGDAIFEGKAGRRTIDGDVRERVRLRVTPKGQYTINFEPENKGAKK